jgi:hypothetical protein
MAASAAVATLQLAPEPQHHQRRQRAEDGYTAANAMVKHRTMLSDHAAAAVIQQAYRGYAKGKRAELDRFLDNVAATRIQAHYRGYKQRVALSRPGYCGNHPKGSRAALRQQHEAAKRIQRQYRTHLVRRRVEGANDSSLLKGADGSNPMRGRGRPTWPCGHRRIAYDGAILPDPCQIEKVMAWDAAWKENASGGKKSAAWKNSEQLPLSHRGKAVEEIKPVPRRGKQTPGPKMRAKQGRRYQNSYLETFAYKTYEEKLESIENAYDLVEDNPTLHPDLARDISPDVKAMAHENVWGAPDVLEPIPKKRPLPKDANIPIGRNHSCRGFDQVPLVRRNMQRSLRSGGGTTGSESVWNFDHIEADDEGDDDGGGGGGAEEWPYTSTSGQHLQPRIPRTPTPLSRAAKKKGYGGGYGQASLGYGKSPASRAASRGAGGGYGGSSSYGGDGPLQHHLRPPTNRSTVSRGSYAPFPLQEAPMPPKFGQQIGWGGGGTAPDNGRSPAGSARSRKSTKRGGGTAKGAYRSVPAKPRNLPALGSPPRESYYDRGRPF